MEHFHFASLFTLLGLVLARKILTMNRLVAFLSKDKEFCPENCKRPKGPTGAGVGVGGYLTTPDIASEKGSTCMTNNFYYIFLLHN